jgi:hypothetical protein
MSRDLLKQTIRLAHQNPELRVHLLPLIKQAMEFDTQNALDKYLKDHPKANKSNHTVKEQGGSKKQKTPKAEHPGTQPVRDEMNALKELGKTHSERSGAYSTAVDKALEYAMDHDPKYNPDDPEGSAERVQPGGKFFKKLPPEMQKKFKQLDEEDKDDSSSKFFKAQTQLQFKVDKLPIAERRKLKQEYGGDIEGIKWYA